jgi:hypothetical protein
MEYLSRMLREEEKAKWSEEPMGEEAAKLLAVSRERGKRASAAIRQTSRLSALYFREGDRVRMLGTDFYSGVQEGDTGTVDLVQGAWGLSPYPDPAKMLVMVRWDKGGRVPVPRKMLEKISKRKADQISRPASLLRSFSLSAQISWAQTMYPDAGLECAFCLCGTMLEQHLFGAFYRLRLSA